MLAKLGVIIVMIGADGSLLDGAVPALNLAVGPGMMGLGETVIDVVAGAGCLKGMGTEEFATLPAALDVGGGRADVAGGRGW